jgi:hypothetical protein
LSVWLSGIITIHQGKAADYQAHSAKFTTSLSIVYLGREVIKKQSHISKAEFILAWDRLLQKVINTQLEQGLYD